MKFSNDQRVVVTGIGPICSLGIGKNQVSRNLKIAPQKPKERSYKINNQIVGRYFKYEVKDFNIKKFGLDQQKLDEIKQWKKSENVYELDLLLASIKLAIDDSKVNQSTVSKSNLFVTHENLGLEELCSKFFNFFLNIKCKDNLSKNFEKFFQQNSRSAYEVQSFMALHHIAKVFQVHSFSVFLNNACSSGLYAIEMASNQIRLGKSEVSIVASSDAQNIYKLRWLAESGLYSQKGLIQPFDKNRGGFVSGDGAAAIVLESLKSARRRGAQIYGEYLGGAFNLEGWKVSLPHLSETYYADVIQEAINEAGLSKNEIDLINLHGVGTKINDYYEAKSVTKVFGKNFLKPSLLACKPFIGHNLGNSSLIEIILCFLIMENQFLPKLYFTKNIDEKLGLRFTKKGQNRCFNNFLKLSNGFGGYNGACIFKKVPQ